ncbi:DMT family transporter [Azospirillum sp. HJ39]|uniref:DMT family transporter n=1 Tax=Azospirillum sp. HJ39 TaxID=3159496 RepID=UPI003556D7CC
MGSIARAVLWALASSITFQGLSTLMKLLGATLPPLEIAFVRGAAALALLAVTWRALKAWRSIRAPWIHGLRAGLGTIALLCSVYALSTSMPLALVSVILYSRILVMIPLARMTLGERTSPRLWLATIAGFAGVLLAVSPALALPDQLLGVLAITAAAITSAGSQLAVRRLTATNPSSLIVALYALLSTILLAAPAAAVWVPPSEAEMIGLLSIGLFGAAALYCTAQAYRHAPATIVAPLSFLEIPLAAGLDYLMWGKVPTWQTVIGALVIVSATYAVTRAQSVHA